MLGFRKVLKNPTVKLTRKAFAALIWNEAICFKYF
jgi:hypothetical protein